MREAEQLESPEGEEGRAGVSCAVALSCTNRYVKMSKRERSPVLT